jgi:hypothetical protein
MHFKVKGIIKKGVKRYYELHYQKASGLLQEGE